MKKIVPFNNVLEFNTAVCDIISISLEHDIKKEEGLISGHFYITGEYKITSGQLDNDTFNFDLPFDIALSNNYKLETLQVDIDDFRYEIIDNNKMKVNIDLFLDGEVIEEVPPFEEFIPIEPIVSEEPNDRENLLDEMLTDSTVVEEPIIKENIEQQNNNINNNIFNGFDENENYVTYRVYRVLENDTVDSIIEKYGITKEILASYNIIENIKAGDKLIIPTNDK